METSTDGSQTADALESVRHPSPRKRVVLQRRLMWADLNHPARARARRAFWARQRAQRLPTFGYLVDPGTVAANLARQLLAEQAIESEERTRRLELHLAERVSLAREEERKRLARELHDDHAQALSALQLELAGAPASDLSAEFRHRLAESVRNLVGSLYALLKNLRPAMLEELGLEQAIARLAAGIGQRGELSIDFEPVGRIAGLPASVELALYRVAQEALNNVVRHAGASQASVVLLRTSSEVTLLVEDDGCGFEVRSRPCCRGPGGLGITGMQERIQLVGGRLMVDSAKGRGTSVRATVPCPLEPNEPREAGELHAPEPDRGGGSEVA
jgi:signal transduction histidine kinase